MNGCIYKAQNIDELTYAIPNVLVAPEICKKMGWKSLEIISAWDFKADIRGLRQAVELV